MLFYCVNGRKLVCNFVSSNCPPDSSTVYDVVAQWFSKTQCGFLSCSFELICLFCFFFIHNAWVLSFNISNWDDFRFRLSWNAFDTQNLSWNPTIKLLLNSTHMWPVLVSILQNYVWQICNNCFLVRFWKKTLFSFQTPFTNNLHTTWMFKTNGKTNKTTDTLVVEYMKLIIKKTTENNPPVEHIWLWYFIR